MAFTIPYTTSTFRAPNALIPGNEEAPDPVEFDLAPPEGPDIARIRSLLVATYGIVGEWTPETQRSVIAALANYRTLFDETVTAVRGLTVPYAMALRTGVVPAPNPDAPKHDLTAKVPIKTGADFSKVQGFFPELAFVVATEILKLKQMVDLDVRFIVPPFGLRPQEDSQKAAPGSVSDADPTSAG